jgi:hypothetical protein
VRPRRHRALLRGPSTSPLEVSAQMRPTARRALRFLAVASTILAAFLICVVLVVRHSTRCDRFESLLATDGHGRTVKSTFEACTLIGTATQEWVDLVTTSGRHRTIMAFVPWGGEGGPGAHGPFEPVVTWTTPGAMHISIGTVGSITEKHDSVDGVDVTYDIGTILHK